MIKNFMFEHLNVKTMKVSHSYMPHEDKQISYVDLKWQLMHFLGQKNAG